MKRTCAYPGCGSAFEAKRSDARFCSDTCRAKASKDRARERRAGTPAVRTPRGIATASPAERDAADEVAARLAALEQRLATAEAGVTRAEADRAGWKKVRDQLQAALARVEGGRSPDRLAAAVRAEVSHQIAGLAQRLDAVEAAQAALRNEVAKLTAAGPLAKASELMIVGKEVGKLNTRLRLIERDLREFSEGVAEAADEE